MSQEQSKKQKDTIRVNLAKGSFPQSGAVTVGAFLNEKAENSVPVYLYVEQGKQRPMGVKGISKDLWLPSGKKNYLISQVPDLEHRDYKRVDGVVKSFEDLQDRTGLFQGHKAKGAGGVQAPSHRVEGRLSYEYAKSDVFPTLAEEMLAKWKMFTYEGYKTAGATGRVLGAKFPYFRAQKLVDDLYNDCMSENKYEYDACSKEKLATGEYDFEDRCRAKEPHRNAVHFKKVQRNGEIVEEPDYTRPVYATDEDYIDAFGEWKKHFGLNFQLIKRVNDDTKATSFVMKSYSSWFELQFKSFQIYQQEGRGEFESNFVEMTSPNGTVYYVEATNEQRKLSRRAHAAKFRAAAAALGKEGAAAAEAGAE